MSLWRRLLRRPGHPPPAPEGEVVAIGDVHGRADLLERMIDLVAREHPGATVVAVGDYVDRGPESRRALEIVRGAGLVALRGNHEAMLLGFIDDPFYEAPRWLRVGGRETLASFGVDPPGPDDDPGAAAEALREALGDAEGWLRGLPMLWRSGNLLAVHAAADPARPPEELDERVALWGHPGFPRRRRSDGLWVVHGHSVVRVPMLVRGRVAIDTGAWKSGRLTAAAFSEDGRVRFLSIRG